MQLVSDLLFDLTQQRPSEPSTAPTVWAAGMVMTVVAWRRRRQWRWQWWWRRWWWWRRQQRRDSGGTPSGSRVRAARGTVPPPVAVATPGVHHGGWLRRHSDAASGPPRPSPTVDGYNLLSADDAMPRPRVSPAKTATQTSDGYDLLSADDAMPRPRFGPAKTATQTGNGFWGVVVVVREISLPVLDADCFRGELTGSLARRARRQGCMAPPGRRSRTAARTWSTP